MRVVVVIRRGKLLEMFLKPTSKFSDGLDQDVERKEESGVNSGFWHK